MPVSRVGIAVFMAGLSMGGPAAAQGIANSLQELRLLVRVGDTVRVTNVNGQTTQAKIAVLSAQALELTQGAGTRAFTEKDIASISQRRSDPLSNGALWGLGIGAGFVGIGLAIDQDVSAGVATVATVVYGAIGAGIGVGVDALISKHTTIYERPAGVGARLQVSPLLSLRAAGARLTLTF